MADLSDVSAALATLAALAVYPNGIGQPSVAGIDIRVFPGWPIPAQLDADMKAGKANVSISPMAGTSGSCYQPLDRYDVLVAPVHGLSVSVSGTDVFLTGTPGQGEYCTLILDGRLVVSKIGASAAEILDALLADLLVQYPGASRVNDTLSIPGAHRVVARIGAPGVMGYVTHRQKQGFLVTVWAPTPMLRDAISAPIQVLLSQNQHLSLQDGSQATLLFDRINEPDLWEATTIYKRDLIYNVEYATVPRLDAHEVTSVNVTAQDGGVNPTYPY